MEIGHHIISLDLGFADKPTALAAVKPKTDYNAPEGVRREVRNHFDVVHLERFEAGVGYPQIVARTKEITSDRERIDDFTLLANIATSGPAPLKLFNERLLYPQTFVVLNGSGEGWKGAAEGVSKRTMIGAAQVMLQAERLRIANGLDLGQALFDELLNFRMKPPRTDATVEAIREKPNDDLVFAVSLACWWSDRLVWNEQDDTWPDDDGWGNADDLDRSQVSGY